jgi:hypothetical protein
MMTRRLWVPVLVAALAGALLAVIVIGPLGAQRDAGAVQSRVTVTRTVTLPAAAFSPRDNDTDYFNNSAVLYTHSGSGDFIAPLFFEAPVVRIKRIVLYAYDGGASDVCVKLLRFPPTLGDGDLMGQACSTGSAYGARSFTQTSLTYRVITGGYGPALWLSLPGDQTDYVFYAVRIVYSYDTGT